MFTFVFASAYAYLAYMWSLSFFLLFFLLFFSSFFSSFFLCATLPSVITNLVYGVHSPHKPTLITFLTYAGAQ